MPFEITHDRGVAVVTMAMPSGNTIDPAFCAEATAALSSLEASEARAAVLTAEGAIFSVGLNLVALGSFDRAAMSAFVDLFDGVFLRLFTLRLPVVAAINGHAIAGGAVLAFCCDERRMARGGGKIGVTETTLGIPFPAAAFTVSASAVPPPRWAEAMLEGKRFSADEALSAGLVHGLDDDPLSAAVARARALAQIPPSAVAQVKADLRAPLVERVLRDQASMRERFLDAWFSPVGQARVGEARAKLLARKG